MVAGKRGAEVDLDHRILNSVIRDVWTDDRMRSRCSGATLADWGPPWHIYRYVGDNLQWYGIPLESTNGFRNKVLVTIIDEQVSRALDELAKHHLTVSDALEAGERRRCWRINRDKRRPPRT